MSRHRLLTLAMLKKLAAPLGMLALIGAGTVTSTGCELISTVDRSQIAGGTGGLDGTGGDEHEHRRLYGGQ